MKLSLIVADSKTALWTSCCLKTFIAFVSPGIHVSWIDAIAYVNWFFHNSIYFIEPVLISCLMGGHAAFEFDLFNWWILSPWQCLLRLVANNLLDIVANVVMFTLLQWCAWCTYVLYWKYNSYANNGFMISTQETYHINISLFVFEKIGFLFQKKFKRVGS
jgi:hypothetical protein